MIPRRTAYRVWQACCDHQARRLRALADDSRPDPRRGRRGDPARAGGRAARADDLARVAGVLASWVASEGPPGGDLDPAVVGLVAAYLHQHTPAAAELRRWAEARGRASSPSPADTIAFVAWILET